MTDEQPSSRLIRVEEQLDNLKKDVDEIKEGTRWIFRTFMGGIILAVVAFAIRGGFMPL